MKFYLPAIALLATCLSCTNNTPTENYVPLGDVLTKSSATGGTQTGSSSETGGKSGKINPAHGQPGHRCDLPEGSPLPDNTPATPPTSATPAQAQPPVTNVTSTPAASTPNEIKVTPAPVTASKAGGLNPEHGKPGHRCDIAVGSPLNSKPTTSTTAATTQPQTTVVPTPAKTTTAPGMNPPHGEPGHRCDIAVGSPLKSADNKAAKDIAPQPVKLTEKDTSKN